MTTTTQTVTDAQGREHYVTVDPATGWETTHRGRGRGIASQLEQRDDEVAAAALAQAQEARAHTEAARREQEERKEQEQAKLQALVAGADTRAWFVASEYMRLEAAGVAAEALPPTLTQHLTRATLGLARAEQVEESIGTLDWQQSRQAVAHALAALEAALPISRDRPRFLQAAEEALCGLPGGAWSGSPSNPLGGLTALCREAFDAAVDEQVGAVSREKDAVIAGLVALVAKAGRGFGVARALSQLDEADEEALKAIEAQVRTGGTVPAGKKTARPTKATKEG